MTRSPLIFVAALGIALAGPVQAQDYVSGITGQLRDLGFEQIEVRQTLLGRARIIARSAEGQREIILNPNNGEILRDFWQAAPGQSATSRLVDNRNSGGSSGVSDRSGSNESGNAGSDDSNDDASGSAKGNDNRSGSDDRDDDNGSDDDGSDESDDGSDDRDDGSDGSDDGSDDSGGGGSDDSNDD